MSRTTTFPPSRSKAAAPTSTCQANVFRTCNQLMPMPSHRAILSSLLGKRILMPESRPLTLLCITTYEKGQAFMRECKRQGCHVLLLTAEKLRDADWPRESLDDTFYLPAELPLADIVQAVTHLARTHKLDRIVALDEFDMETAATLREHLRVPGMGLTTMRYFRDKLAMRMRALDRGVRVPDFVPVFNHNDIRYYLENVRGPWVLKPRQEASAIGIKKIYNPDELWTILERLGDKQSTYLLEKFVPGEVYHVDSVVSENDVVFANVSKYGKPPMNVAQGGGVFTTFTVPRGTDADTGLRTINRELIAALGLMRGVAHTEFIQAHEDGHFYFLEWGALTSARWLRPLPTLTCGGSGRVSRSLATTARTNSRRCAKNTPAWSFPSRGRKIRTLRHTTIRKCACESRSTTTLDWCCGRTIRTASAHCSSTTLRASCMIFSQW